MESTALRLPPAMRAAVRAAARAPIVALQARVREPGARLGAVNACCWPASGCGMIAIQLVHQ